MANNGELGIDNIDPNEYFDLNGAIMFNGELTCVSGEAGTYTKEDWTIQIPEDGTYFPFDPSIYVNMLLKRKEANND